MADEATSRSAGGSQVDRGVRHLALKTTAGETARQIARALFALAELEGLPCSRIQFKMGVYPDNERDGGGLAEKPLAEFIERKLEQLARTTGKSTGPNVRGGDKP